MRPLTVLFIALLFAFSGPAVADGEVTLTPGQGLTFRITPSGGATVTSRESNPSLAPVDELTARRFLSGELDFAVGSRVDAVTSGDPRLPVVDPVSPGVVHLKFVQLPAGRGQAFLVVENGYDLALVYRARIRIGKRSTETDVCRVIPLRRGYEHWPYPIDEISLSDFRFEPWSESDRLTCE